MRYKVEPSESAVQEQHKLYKLRYDQDLQNYAPHDVVDKEACPRPRALAIGIRKADAELIVSALNEFDISLRIAS